VEAGLSITLLPGLAVDRRYRVVMRELAAPVNRAIAAVIRRGTQPRAAVNVVVDALRQRPDLPAMIQWGGPEGT
jgi:DNA-binding transcriptional LysR family regulator